MRTRSTSSPRPGAAARGMSLVELVVALTIIAVGVLGLAAATLFAQRAFTGAAAIEQSAAAAAAVLDSLMHEPAPVAGERGHNRAIVRWTVTPDSVGPEPRLSRITASVEIVTSGGPHVTTWHAVHSGSLVR
jgi:prepilin-type N-terminal cleavage/methylation domain-containing protein